MSTLGLKARIIKMRVAFGLPHSRCGVPQERKYIATHLRITVAKQSMVTVTYVHLVGERWLIKPSSGKIARAANREKWLAETQQGQ